MRVRLTRCAGRGSDPDHVANRTPQMRVRLHHNRLVATLEQVPHPTMVPIEPPAQPPRSAAASPAPASDPTSSRADGSGHKTGTSTPGDGRWNEDDLPPLSPCTSARVQALDVEVFQVGEREPLYGCGGAISGDERSRAGALRDRREHSIERTEGRGALEETQALVQVGLGYLEQRAEEIRVAAGERDGVGPIAATRPNVREFLDRLRCRRRAQAAIRSRAGEMQMERRRPDWPSPRCLSCAAVLRPAERAETTGQGGRRRP